VKAPICSDDWQEGFNIVLIVVAEHKEGYVLRTLKSMRKDPGNLLLPSN
jgi:hypothetical protein